MSLKAADGAVLERRRLTKNHAAMPAMAAIPTTPPTTPPAIAPTFELFDVDVGDCALEDDAIFEVKVASVLAVEVIIEPVDCTLVAVDSGVSTREGECQFSRTEKLCLTSSKLRCRGVEHVTSHLPGRLRLWHLEY